MGDEVTCTRDGRTYRVRGLQAKSQSIAGASFETDGILSGRVGGAEAALTKWLGPHTQTFVQDANTVLSSIATLKVQLRHAGNVVASFLDAPVSTWGSVHQDDEVYFSSQIEAPAEPGTAGADTSLLRASTATASGQDDRFATLAGVVNLDGATAEVTYDRPLTEAERQRALDHGETPANLDNTLVLQTNPVDPSTLITLPTVGDQQDGDRPQLRLDRDRAHGD